MKRPAHMFAVISLSTMSAVLQIGASHADSTTGLERSRARHEKSLKEDEAALVKEKAAHKEKFEKNREKAIRSEREEIRKIDAMLKKDKKG